MLLGELDIGVGNIQGKLNSVGDSSTAMMKQLDRLGDAVESLTDHLENGGQSTEVASSGFSKLGAVALVATAALAAVAAVASGLSDVLDFGGKLNDLSLFTGEAAGDMVILGQAFENAGLGSDAAGDFVLKLQDSIAGVNSESGAAIAALDKMGVSADSLRTQTAIQQIETLQEGFAKLDQTSKVAAARDIFGKGGGKVLALMNDSGAMAQAKEQATPLAMTMQANLDEFDKLGDALNGVALNGKEFFAGFLEPLAPFFTKLADSLGSVDFTVIGRGFGNIASGIITVFSALWEGLKALGSFVDKLSGGAFSKAGEVIGNIGAAIAGEAKVADENDSRQTKRSDKAGKLSDPESQVSALQRVGGGGGFGGGDPMLTESQRQTSLLQRIADKLPGGNGSSNYIPVPV